MGGITLKKTNKMKTKEFSVPKEAIIEFAEKIAEHNLDNEILGTNDDSHVAVEIRYNKNEQMGVFELFEIVENYEDEQEED